MSDAPREPGVDADAAGVTPGAEEAEAAEVVLDDLAVARIERDEYLGTLQRLQADFENYRKRVARTSEEAADRAAGALVSALLPAIDALDLAVAHFAASESEEATAIRRTRDLVIDTLAREGLERVEATGVEFDPAVHDAVAHVEGDGDGAAQVVDEVLRAGFRWRGSVLRPAMVRVRG